MDERAAADAAWQRELDADRRRAESGGGVDTRGARPAHGGGTVDADLAAYYGGCAPPPPMGAPPAAMPQSMGAVPPEYAAAYPLAPTPMGVPGGPPAFASTPYEPPPQEHVYDPYAFPTDFDEIDRRFNVKFVSLLPEHTAKFASKIGRLLYFTSNVDGYFKGVFGASKRAMALFVTPRCIWLGDVASGRLVICKDILDIRTLFVLGPSGVGMRTGQGADIYFKGLNDRPRFVTVVKRLFDQHEAQGTTLTIIEGSVEREESYRKEIRYLPMEEWEYALVEDPRTGLPLVRIPQQHMEHYGPLAPKNLHYFSGCFQVSVDRFKKTSGTRRGCWITPTCVFLSVHTGPKPDGKDIRRCIPVESIRFLVNGPGFSLGFNIDSKPPQPDCIIDFDDAIAKRTVMFVLERTYRFRTGQVLLSRDAPNFSVLNIVDETKFQPYLHHMKTIADLYGLLRGKT
jgi:hypothetical protein